MAKRYAIWDRQTEVYTPGMDPNLKGLTYSTPAGTSHFTPEEWMMLHPAPPRSVIICDAGDFNGAYFGTLGQMIRIYEAAGADFSNATTDEEKLDVIEAFEDEAKRAAANQVSPESRIASALELSNLLRLDAEQTDDPDVI